ncbi:1809_t:CDS:2 [Acaulospora morrowiae]|uniref:1809_t:CDS:1 n=1 Tax=Acaulospora morrowiae TaxID=94023 RepID=A0A9N9ESY8_9GLOM|nr:1809_t:CDS:2 [Acaulospora morrowiae]
MIKDNRQISGVSTGELRAYLMYRSSSLSKLASQDTQSSSQSGAMDKMIVLLHWTDGTNILDHSKSTNHQLIYLSTAMLGMSILEL